MTFFLCRKMRYRYGFIFSNFLYCCVLWCTKFCSWRKVCQSFTLRISMMIFYLGFCQGISVLSRFLLELVFCLCELVFGLCELVFCQNFSVRISVLSRFLSELVFCLCELVFCQDLSVRISVLSLQMSVLSSLLSELVFCHVFFQNKYLPRVYSHNVLPWLIFQI